jgi:hypothetical protein
MRHFFSLFTNNFKNLAKKINLGLMVSLSVLEMLVIVTDRPVPPSCLLYTRGGHPFILPLLLSELRKTPLHHFFKKQKASTKALAALTGKSLKTLILKFLNHI